MEHIINVKGKPYYFHKLCFDMKAIHRFRRRYRRVRYYYMKAWSNRLKKPYYILYTDRRIT